VLPTLLPEVNTMSISEVQFIKKQLDEGKEKAKGAETFDVLAENQSLLFDGMVLMLDSHEDFKNQMNLSVGELTRIIKQHFDPEYGSELIKTPGLTLKGYKGRTVIGILTLLIILTLVAGVIASSGVWPW